MTQYLEHRQAALQTFVEQCELRYGMSSGDFVDYYREPESHGTEEEYDWWVALSFLGIR